MARERSAIGEADRLTLTVEQAAHLLGISRGLAYELARSGKLPVLRFGRRLLIPKGALEKMLNQWDGTVSPDNSCGRQSLSKEWDRR
jgi:excisionase family DNA binding protein